MMQAEKSSKVLDNFEPFNEVWYKNCFYNSLLPVIKHFNKDVRFICANEIMIYHLKNDTKRSLYLESQAKMGDISILHRIGIDVHLKYIGEDIVDELIHSINNNMPVLISIDCYYEPMRDNTYQKKHLSHYLLVFGYHQEKKTFNIIEHKYEGSTLYEKRIISYEDIKNCYVGYLNYFYKEKQAAPYLEFYTCEEKDVNHQNETCVDVYYKNLLENRTEIYKNLELIKSYKPYFIEQTLNENILKENVDILYDSFFNIVNFKKVEQYCALKILNKEYEFYSIIDSVINNWGLIKGVIMKYKITGKYYGKSYERAAETLDAIFVDEIKWYDHLFSALSEEGKSK